MYLIIQFLKKINKINYFYLSHDTESHLVDFHLFMQLHIQRFQTDTWQGKHPIFGLPNYPSMLSSLISIIGQKKNWIEAGLYDSLFYFIYKLFLLFIIIYYSLLLSTSYCIASNLMLDINYICSKKQKQKHTKQNIINTIVWNTYNLFHVILWSTTCEFHDGKDWPSRA